MGGWTFDRAVANNYDSIVEHNIPDYDAVIKKCLTYADAFHTQSHAILDVGCANGNTLAAFRDAGYRNLHGTENSNDMIKACSRLVPEATISKCNEFPQGKYDLVLANWVLHFIKDPDDRTQYITSAIDSLNRHGAMIITDKTDCDDMIDLYHDWKEDQGMSPEAIKAKAEAIEGVLIPLGYEWYTDLFKQLNVKTTVINANWCFTTFLIRRR